MQIKFAPLALALACVVCACAQQPSVPDPNSVPTANAGPDQEVTLSSGTANVTLDGSGSRDPDGTIKDYRWLSAVKRTDGKTGRQVPEGEAPEWPDDVQQPMVTLPRGLWVFSLQVTDDAGLNSVADTVVINVGPVDVPAAAGGAGGAAGGGGGTGAGTGGR